MTPSGQTVCLCMIVKDEAPVIRRCLDSVRPLIDSWVIVDTGSTDGTQAIVREHLRDIPGELVERPWRDFAHNRTEALALARPMGDYSLIIDADDAMVVPEGFRLPVLDADSYAVDIDFGAIRYSRPQFVRADLGWHYEGVIHEYLACRSAKTTGHLPLVLRIYQDGARRRDPETYKKDAAVLERAVAEETDPFKLSRYTFYLAQSYRDSGQGDKAVPLYLERAEMGFWDQEVYCSLLYAGRLQETLGHEPDTILATYARADGVCPWRAEAAHAASHLCRKIGRNQQGYSIARKVIDVSLPSDGLFVESWIYSYGLLDEFAINAYWADHHLECMDACLRMLCRTDLPGGYRERVLANARFASDRLRERAAPTSGGIPILRSVPAHKAIPRQTHPAAPAGGRKALVSIVTPTRGRPDFLDQAWRYVEHQTYEAIEWLIVDDSPQPFPRASELLSANVSYEHVARPLTIGEKRNMLVAKARGEIIVHFDDDDYYAPNYVATMVEALSEMNADLINLRGWFLHDLRSSFFGYWDLECKDGPHFRCDRDGVALLILNDSNKNMFDRNEIGYGFSYVFRRAVWEQVAFPALDWNEDGRFAIEVSKSFKVGGIYDTTGICLHYLHSDSTSRCFPQHQIPTFMIDTVFPTLDGDRSTTSQTVPASIETERTRHDASSSSHHRRSAFSSWRPVTPMGGTELMVTGLRERLGGILDSIRLCINEYDLTNDDPRPLVVWIHLDINQSRIHWLYDREKANRVDWFVFVSDWQRERFVGVFNLRPERCVVLRNATEANPIDRTWTPGTILKVAYTTVPYRGLDVLLNAWEQLNPEGAELHIWSSNKLYGPDWDDTANQSLYDRANALPSVVYHGIVPNPALRTALRGMDILGYPSTVEETSCIAVMEAMAAGCRIVCPAYGALPETSGGFARLYPMEADPVRHARIFAAVLKDEMSAPWGGQVQRAVQQQDLVRRKYDWSVRVLDWKEFINTAVQQHGRRMFEASGTGAIDRVRERSGASTAGR